MSARRIGQLADSRLRAIRTRFVHRWHAAQTIGEWFGNDDVGHRFEHINHARSLAEYIWRYGAFAESPDGTGRAPVKDTHSLRSIVRPVVRKGHSHFEKAVRCAALFGGDQHRAATQPLSPTQHRLLRYASENPDVAEFAVRLVDLHRAMLLYYTQMRYLTAAKAERYRKGRHPGVGALRQC